MGSYQSIPEPSYTLRVLHMVEGSSLHARLWFLCIREPVDLALILHGILAKGNKKQHHKLLSDLEI